MGNIPEPEDEIGLFKLITKFTTVSSFQLSNLSLQKIIKFNPSELHSNISEVNTGLVDFFVLATKKNRQLDQNEKIQHTINTYGKILQPKQWAQWTRNKAENFEDGRITDCQKVMNSATLKYNKIISGQGKFGGSVSTVQE